MKLWPVHDAKARFSEFLETCLSEGPQVVSRRGRPEAVLVAMAEWERLQDRARPTLKALLLSHDARGELVLPERGSQARRPIDML